MAIHTQRVGLVKESIVEMIHVATYCVQYRKDQSDTWGRFATGGILGFPSAILLFSAIDCFGSLFRGNSDFKIPIDGQLKTISNKSEHVYILNSPYFGLALRKIDLERIYKNVRSPLTHSSMLPEGYILYDKDEIHNDAIRTVTDRSGNMFYCVYLIPLCELVEKAARMILDDLDNGKIDFDNSLVNQELKKRDSNVKVDLFKEHGIELMRVNPDK